MSPQFRSAADAKASPARRWLPLAISAAWCLTPVGAPAAEDAWHASEATQPQTHAPNARTGEPLFAGLDQLSRSALVRAVLERNPSIDAARRGWKIALARAPQSAALDDPMASFSVAPLSLGAGIRVGQEVMVRQRLPFPGKRSLAEAIARAEADAAMHDFEAARLSLALIASNLIDDYYVVDQALRTNAEHTELLHTLKRAAEAEYAAGRVSLQDPLRAEVELAALEEERLALTTERAVVTTQINGLLHRDLHLPLPPPADPGEPEAMQDNVQTMARRAVESRPEFRAAGARIRSGEAAVDLAAREYFPDFEFMSSYSSMWDMREHRWMAGVAVNVPIQLDRRRAAADEAAAQLAQSIAAEQHARVELEVEVTRAHLRVEEAQHVVALYAERTLPAARDQIAAAEAGFGAGRAGFADVIEAERSLRNATLRFHSARAELHRRIAELDRVVGRIPGIEEGGSR